MLSLLTATQLCQKKLSTVKSPFFYSFNTHYVLKFGLVCRFIGSGVSNSKTYLTCKSSGLGLQVDGKYCKKGKQIEFGFPGGRETVS